MLKIRLQRTGRVNNPAYRFVLTESINATRSGKFQEILGNYDPKAGTITLKEDRVKHWIKMGAQPTGTVHNFLVDRGIISGKKKNVLPKKTKQAKKEEAK